ncbi:MAG: metallopeptidase family protein [Myxococcales bacterium]|nr:metallopeptidase family protein [Myxococcales bacterium]
MAAGGSDVGGKGGERDGHDRLDERDERDELDELAREVEALLETEPARALARLDAAPPALQREPELDYLRGLARWELAGPAAARPELERAVARDPGFAAARHALGEALGQLDDHAGMVAQWLEVRRLDARVDRERGRGRLSARQWMARVAEEVLASVPEELRARLGNVSVVLEPRPGRGIIEEGFDPRALGLFEGPDDFGQRSVHAPPTPSRIVLFYMNLEASFPERDALAEEIEVTILHELGHYFGLDEDDVERLGLE